MRDDLSKDRPQPARPAEAADVALSGGNWTAVTRRGQEVHRSAGPWTPTVHRLLEHLHARGTTWLPRPLGTDEQGREVLTYLPGTVPTYPMPAFVWAEDVLTTAAGWLAHLHAASAGFDTTGAVWQLPAHEPVEVVCLNDVAPYNMVFDQDGRLAGWIDVDTASPGPRVWDLAYLAYRLVPLSAAEDTGAGAPDVVRGADRFRRLCAAYADSGDHVTISTAAVLRTAVVRLHDLADWTAARAAAGAEHVSSHAALYRRDAAWLERNAQQLAADDRSQ